MVTLYRIENGFPVGIGKFELDDLVVSTNVSMMIYFDGLNLQRGVKAVTKDGEKAGWIRFTHIDTTTSKSS